MNPALAARLDALVAGADRAAALARDPVRFPRRYADPADAEVAAAFAALLAFGRVDLFGPVVAAVLDRADARGGPAAWVDRFDAADARDLAPLGYRWFRAADLADLARTLGAVRRAHGGLGALFVPGPARTSLGGAIDRLRGLAPAGTSPAFATFFPHPADGSACKRWLMLLRWMVRRDAVDLGLWSHLSPADLLVPVDTHVHRVARFLGLTDRAAADWRAAEAITAALRACDALDPVRYDFALAHLGISGACRGHRDPAICPGCPLDPLCRAPTRPSGPATPAAAARRSPAARRGRRGTA